MNLRMLTLALLASSPCLAQTLDQSFVPGTTTVSYGVDNTWTRAQTFTVGLNGTLTGIDLLMSGSSSNDLLYWDVRSTTAGVPNSSNTVTLASGSVVGSSVPASSYYHFDLTSFGISVTAGDVLAVTLFGTTGNTVGGMKGRSDDSYAGGGAFQGTPGGATTTWSSLSGVDFGFKSYVAVPEPGVSAAVGGLAAVLLLGVRRRDRCAPPGNG